MLYKLIQDPNIVPFALTYLKKAICGVVEDVDAKVLINCHKFDAVNYAAINDFSFRFAAQEVSRQISINHFYQNRRHYHRHRP